MSSVRASVLIACALQLSVVLGGCASAYQVVRIPEREADLYPLSQTKERVTIAIDEVKAASRAERYFGADLISEGILPLVVVVSNYSERPVNVKPSDILLHRGREIVDPLPIDVVRAIAKSQQWFLRARTGEQIDGFFDSVAFAETALPPNETYQGVLFFSFPKQQRRQHSLFMISNLYKQGGPRVRVGVTDLDTRERLHFGPFSLSPPEEFY